MKLKFSYLTYAIILIALVIGVSRVYALTGPASTAPTQSEIPTPVNNSGEVQIKKGSVTTKGDLGSSSYCGSIGNFAWYDLFPENSNQDARSVASSNPVSTCIQGGAAIATGFLVSPWGFFTQIITSSVIVGDSSSQSGNLPAVSEPQSADPTSMKLDLVGRGTANNSVEGTQAISIYSGNLCSTYTTITVNGPAIGFNSSANSGTADVLARQVRLTAGNPKPDSVFTGTWATLKVENGQIVATPN